MTLLGHCLDQTDLGQSLLQVLAGSQAFRQSYIRTRVQE